MKHKIQIDISGTLDAKTSLYDTIVFDSRDWSMNPKDAWIYGIIVGWDQACLRELQIKHNWDDNDIKRLSILHSQFNFTRIK